MVSELASHTTCEARKNVFELRLSLVHARDCEQSLDPEAEGAIVQKFPPKSALSLLETRILLVDDETLALTDNDLAIASASFDA